MSVELFRTLAQLNGINRNVGAVIANFLQVMHNVKEVDTSLHSAFITAQSLDMAALETFLEGFDHLFDRFHGSGHRHRARHIAFHR